MIWWGLANRIGRVKLVLAVGKTGQRVEYLEGSAGEARDDTLTECPLVDFMHPLVVIFIFANSELG